MTARLMVSRRGFTLIELLTVMVVIGILAGIALPTLRDATYRADAVRIVADMDVVRLSVFEFREDNGRLPGGSGWGATPPALIPYLDQMPFAYKDVEYRLRTVRRRGRVEFIVRYPRASRAGDALKRFRRPGNASGSVSWTRCHTKFRVLVDNQ